MTNKKKKSLLAFIFVCGLLLAACQKESSSATNSSESQESKSTTSSVVATAADTSSTNELKGNYHDEDYNDDTTTIDTTLTLSGSSATIEGTGAVLKDGVLAITQGGNYALSGDFTGEITVNTTEEVHLIFNGVTLSNPTGSALNIIEADKVIITLAQDTMNTVSDGANYSETSDDGTTAAIYSKADLTFNGSGTLKVSGKYKNAIQSKDDLTFIAGSYEVDAVGDAIKGKDKVAILAGTYDLTTTGGDGIQSTNTEESDKGYVAIDGGTFTINSQSDGVQAATILYLQQATMAITTTGELSAASDAVSLKGLKASGDIVMNSGVYTIDAVDDSLHSDSNITINGGTLDLASQDDGIHADSTLTINDGTVTISQSNEGLEGATINLAGGTIDVTASDDGLNASAGSTTTSAGGFGGGGGMDQSDGSVLNITGGTLIVNADGDGLDSNGDITMSGGNVTVYGPTNGGNGALDYAGTFELTGGTLMASGAAGMAQSVSNDSTTTNFELYLDSQVNGGAIEISQDGKILGSYTSAKSLQTIVFASTELKTGTVTVKVGDDSYTLTLTETSSSLNQDGSTYSGGQMGGGMGGGGRQDMPQGGGPTRPDSTNNSPQTTQE
ncbi:carbohydrate-binding domain-containing protein [Enterococcus nangangensis]|uniref:carbohydrate-binding domain-containing protein n=1 Tax=Enterococcus nangangensis TaxID=2559926 RepID=UPI0010F46646|nr:carbohydrate-binding domain-containing protein [Enterococcus nangangensis]